MVGTSIHQTNSQKHGELQFNIVIKKVGRNLKERTKKVFFFIRRSGRTRTKGVGVQQHPAQRHVGLADDFKHRLAAVQEELVVDDALLQEAAQLLDQLLRLPAVPGGALSDVGALQRVGQGRSRRLPRPQQSLDSRSSIR